MRSKLEESVARAAEDAQMQINTHSVTNNKLEKLLAGLRENFEATKHGAHTHIVSNDNRTEWSPVWSVIIQVTLVYK